MLNGTDFVVYVILSGPQIFECVLVTNMQSVTVKMVCIHFTVILLLGWTTIGKTTLLVCLVVELT